MEVQTYTNTFYLPVKTPHFVSKKEQAFHDIKTDEKDRRTFSHQIEAMKSVDMNAQA